MAKKKKDEIVYVPLRVNFDIRGKLKNAFVEDCLDRLEKPTVVAREIFYQHYKAKGKL